jgi:hypothetical protein
MGNLGVNGRRVLKQECGDVDRIHVAQDADQWRALLYMVVNFRVR